MYTSTSVFGRNDSCALLTLGLGLLVTSYSYGAEPIPKVASLSHTASEVTLLLENLDTGGTYYIERSTTLGVDSWLRQYAFEGGASTYDWTDVDSQTRDQAFYRVVREPYHPAVGNAGDLVTHHHGVTGHVRILNNRTLVIDDFNFDGAGIFILVYLSPNVSFSPYIALGDDLVRATAYVDEDMTFEIPEGVDLDTYRYVSIWCVPAGVSFGDTVLQAPID